MNAPIQSPRVKLCPRCPEKGPQPLENFHRRMDSSDGHQDMCKACVKENNASRHRERIRSTPLIRKRKCICGRAITKRGAYDCSKCRLQLTERSGTPLDSISRFFGCNACADLPWRRPEDGTPCKCGKVFEHEVIEAPSLLGSSMRMAESEAAE